ncbi:MAG: hypothetical protein ACRC6X_08310 [Culicoidibacterales bacterium]
MRKNIWRCYYQPVTKKKSVLKKLFKGLIYLNLCYTMYIGQEISLGAMIALKTGLLCYYLIKCLCFDMHALKKEVLYIFSEHKAFLRGEYLLYKLQNVVVILLLSWLVLPWSILIDLLLITLWFVSCRKVTQNQSKRKKEIG